MSNVQGPCPICIICASPRVRWLDSSVGTRVDYCRCEACGHVWHQPKPGTSGQITDVTPRPR